MTPKQALAFVKRHGLVLQAARGPVPSLAEAIAGEPIKGSWWGHPRGREIFALSGAVSDHEDVLVCKLIDGKVTFVHRRLWPALVKLSSNFAKGALDRVAEEHTASGKHVARRTAFPKWVPEDVLKAAKALSEDDAQSQLRCCGNLF